MSRKRLQNFIIKEPKSRFIATTIASQYTNANKNSIYNNLVSYLPAYVCVDGQYYPVEGMEIVVIDTNDLDRCIKSRAKVRKVA